MKFFFPISVLPPYDVSEQGGGRIKVLILPVFRCFIQKNLHVAWLMLAVALVILLVALTFFYSSIEDFQTYFFPFLLISFWRLPKENALRAPAPVIILLMLLWGGSALHVRGMVPDFLLSHKVYVSRLLNHNSIRATGELFSRYQQIANRYALPGAQMLQQQLDSGAEAFEWLERHGRALMLVSGHVDWMDITLPQRPAPYFLPTLSTKIPSPESINIAESYHFSLEKHVRLLRVEDFDSTFAFQVLPEQVQLPGKEADLSRHYLAWLAAGLIDSSEITFWKRRDAIWQARSISGPWPTHVPFGLAHYLLGTLGVQQVVTSDVFERGAIECLEQHFQQAAGFVRIQNSPELRGAIFNNAALVRILHAKTAEDFDKARQWLRYSMRITTYSGRPVFAARIAAFNLINLDRLGVALS